MTKVWRDGTTTVLEASLLELFVLQQHCFSVLDRLGGSQEPASSDPFEEWERSLAADADDDIVEEDDPVLHRLFPTAYPDDARASADFRRYTAEDQRRAKTHEVDLIVTAVDRALAGQAGGVAELPPDLPLRIAIPASEFEGWLKALTTLRITLAAELRVTDAEDLEALADLDEDDPRALLVGTMELAGFFQTLLLAANGELEDDV